jgi:hypothetical protein
LLVFAGLLVQLCSQATQASFKLSVANPGKSDHEAMTHRLLARNNVVGDADDAGG